jgi:hypothetical protein
VESLDYQVERILLMLESTEHPLTHSTEKYYERGIAGEVRAQRQQIDKVPDETSQIGMCPARHRRAYENIFLTRVAIE